MRTAALSLLCVVLASPAFGACSADARSTTPAGRSQAAPSADARRASAPPSSVPRYGFRTVKAFKHDRGAFTQGLVYRDGVFFESTGLHGSSSLREVEIKTGRVLRKVDVPEQHFAEGLALVGDRALQLTWQSGKGFVYDAATFAKTGSWDYAGEGWGLAYDGTEIAMSDGTATLRFLDPTTLAVTRTVDVTLDGAPVRELNELEYVEGEVWSNVWQTNEIVRIDPHTGNVVGVIDLTGLLPASLRRGDEDVLNGIAYDPAKKRIFLTGKLWPRVFQVKLRRLR